MERKRFIEEQFNGKSRATLYRMAEKIQRRENQHDIEIEYDPRPTVHRCVMHICIKIHILTNFIFMFRFFISTSV